MTRLFLIISLSAVFSACSFAPSTDVTRYQYDDLRDDDKDGVINARDLCGSTPENVNVDTQGCTAWEVTEKIRFINIPFGFDQSDFPQSQQAAIDEIKQVLVKNPDYRVTVIGDTSPEGTLQYNEALAHKRAHSISSRLQDAGVSDERIDVHYFTETLPIVDENLDKRRHRVVALIHSPDFKHIPAWNIFTSENKLKAQ